MCDTQQLLSTSKYYQKYEVTISNDFVDLESWMFFNVKSV